MAPIHWKRQISRKWFEDLRENTFTKSHEHQARRQAIVGDWSIRVNPFTGHCRSLVLRGYAASKGRLEPSAPKRPAGPASTFGQLGHGRPAAGRGSYD
jgi:hypothetical protein